MRHRRSCGRARWALAGALTAAACAGQPTSLVAPATAPAPRPDEARAAGGFMLLTDVPGVAPGGMWPIALGGAGFIAAGGRLATVSVGRVALVEPAQAADWMCVAADGQRTLVVDREAVLQAPRFGAPLARLGELRDLVGGDTVIYEQDGVVQTATCAGEPAGPAEMRPDLVAARAVTATSIVAPAADSDGELIGLDLGGADPAARRWTRIGRYHGCAPIALRAALFECTRDGRAVVVRVDPDGEAREERAVVEDPARNDLRAGIDVVSPEVAMSGDGGVAGLGGCDGARRHAACVRQPDGTWATVAAPAALRDAMVRFHPFTPDYGPRGAPPMLLPSPAGELFAVFTPRRDRDQRVIARVGGRAAVAVRGLPDWFFADGAATDPASWTTSAGGLRAWPLARGTGAAVATCGIDIDLRGAATAACRPGPVWASGADGVQRRPDGSFVETTDAGRTWQPLTLPPGWDAAGARVECFALGCAFGIYLRLGWSPRRGIVAARREGA
ncbi:MAG: hypothetical protein IPH44_03185 [Myxococcales bacterium]|nr:hypothetical protein [Myxococcales bacterium]MBK7198325.1 hypothetical protein [Myxococcales bacterium]MBP6843491.1 hypothetical protein [Kofleriaceae bacterium]